MENIYEDIARRTEGNIYIGVVGPVRTGKSTFVKRFMEQLVIPGIQDPYRAERARDELPQSGSGKTIMTTEPKFVPEEAVEICPDGKTSVRVRLIDSVGYMVNGAAGAMEDGVPRMVTTPWFDHEIPMTEAAELGTKKVMQEHCSVGLVITTDATVTDISREDYEKAEDQAIRDMKATGKPFLVVVNSRTPGAPTAESVREELIRRHGVCCVTADCQAMDVQQITALLEALLYAFPMQTLHIHLPRWMDALEPEHPLKTALYKGILEHAEKIENLGQAESRLEALAELEQVRRVQVQKVDLAQGLVCCSIVLPDALFYQILSDRSGVDIHSDGQLLKLLTELAESKREYDKISDALSAVKATGYGVVMPTAEEMKLETPEILRKGSTYGVRLKAGAPSIHMIRVDIDTEISPMVGDEKQSRELIAYLSQEDPEKLWQSNIFGKSVYDLIREGLSAKLVGLPEDVRGKFRGTLNRIVNEGAQGLICLIL